DPRRIAVVNVPVCGHRRLDVLKVQTGCVLGHLVLLDLHIHLDRTLDNRQLEVQSGSKYVLAGSPESGQYATVARRYREVRTKQQNQDNERADTVKHDWLNHFDKDFGDVVLLIYECAHGTTFGIERVPNPLKVRH